MAEPLNSIPDAADPDQIRLAELMQQYLMLLNDLRVVAPDAKAK